MNFGFGVAGIVSPMFFGGMIDLTGSWDVPFIVSVAFLLLGAALTVTVHPDHPFTESEDAPRTTSAPQAELASP